MPPKPTWAVVGTMDEPAPLVLAWVAHHLSVGAAEAHVFLDRPNPEVTQALAPIAGAFVTLCDDAYWAASPRGSRPKRHTGRQKLNATAVYERTRADWVLHCDADEFVDIYGDLPAELAQSEARILRLRNLERVRRAGRPAGTVFAGGFRRPLGADVDPETIYGARWSGYLDAGLAGYKGGKEIARTGEPLRMGVHYPIDAATGAQHRDPLARCNSARLLHFDGLTPLHNVLKLLKRAAEPKYKTPRKFGGQRARQIRFAANHAQKPRQMAQMLEGVFSLNDAQTEALGTHYRGFAFDPSAALAQFGLRADLSVAAFDAELRRREADLIARFALDWPG